MPNSIFTDRETTMTAAIFNSLLAGDGQPNTGDLVLANDPTDTVQLFGGALGTNAAGVLALGLASAAPSSSPANSVQAWVADHNGAGTAALHVRNEEGDTITLIKGAALTSKDAGAINSGDATTDGVIANNRTRLEELEARLQAHGLLA